MLGGSGFCALVYQIAWLREFRLIFGASTAASAAVLAIFIGGLGIGGLALGPRADRASRPLRLYANLEATIAISAALSPLLLGLAREAYIATGGAARLGMPVATAGRLVLSALVLAVPTMAMGGTLPAAARAVTRDGDSRRQDVAALYALNAIGAVAGCMAATFWMLEVFGTRPTIWLAAGINGLVAMMARQIDRWSDEPAVAASAGAGASTSLTFRPESGEEGADLPDLPLFALVASATVGFAFFLLELIWSRLLGPLLGGSVFTFGLILAVALAGIGLGGLAYALVAGDRRASLTGFALSALVEAAAVAGTYALGDRLATLAVVLLPLRSAGFAAHVAGWTIVTVIVVLPPALVAGYQFPLLIALIGHGRERVGSHVGFAYAANTAGAIVGSLAGGFGVMPWLSAPVTWRLVAVVLALLGLAAVAIDAIQGRRRRARGDHEWRAVPEARGLSAAALALAAVTGAFLLATGPTAFWRHSGIGAGRVPDDAMTDANRLRAWTQATRRSIEWEADGVESAVALAREPSGLAFVVNGKSDGSARGDAGTQVMLGLLGVLGLPQAQRALVIGLGTGSTAGWLAAVPTIERVDVVELEPVVLQVARACALVNHNAMTNPKVHVVIGDAREALLTTRDRYDVIASEPSNPFRAGIASLFTEEYYRAARERLTPDGVFAQWVQAYEIDAPTLRTIYATLNAVFPSVETWQTNHGDLVLLAAQHRRAYDTRALAARLEQEPFRSAIVNTWRAVDLNGVIAHFLANDRFAREVSQLPAVDINRDDRNIVEFGLARSVGRSGQTLVASIRRNARLAGAWHPPLDNDLAVEWPAVDTAWINFNGWDADVLAAVATPTAGEGQRRLALERYYARGDSAGVRDLWRQQADPPRDPSELALDADVEADAGSDAALPLISRLRQFQPAEADVILAALFARRQQFDASASALESALVRLRTDPWPLLAFKQKALRLAEAVGTRRADLARRLAIAVAAPFALNAVSDERLVTLIDLSRVEFPSMCRAGVTALEPHVIWSESFLRLRTECYAATHDAREPAALRDLNDYLAHEPQPLVTH